MRALVLTLALLAPTLPLAAAPDAVAAAPTCAGRPATIVGSGQSDLRGTAGPDVIVTGGADFVTAGAGDDLVCVTGTTSYVRSDEGDDEVYGGGRALEVDLAAGADSFVGSDAAEVVDTGDGGDLAKTDEVDVVRAGGGDDVVRSGAYEVDLADDIDLGPGNDAAALAGRVLAPGGRLVGGTGSDTLLLKYTDTYLDSGVPPAEGDPDRGRDWVFTNTDPGAGGHADAGGVRKLAWTSFERFSLDAEVRSYAFVGGPAAETLAADGVRYALMGGGNDSVESFEEPVARLDGGPGRDHLQTSFCGGRAVADLRTHRYRCVYPRSVETQRLVGIEDLTVVADRARVTGTRRGDRIAVQACGGVVIGGGGRDQLSVLNRDGITGYFGACGGRPNGPGVVELRGGKGNDVLRGSRRGDVLLGGAGFDRAFGLRGSDVCRAERRVGCER